MTVTCRRIGVAALALLASAGPSGPAIARPDLPTHLSLPEGVAVVGLGEAAHGTREFAEIQHQLVASLARDGDLMLVALEIAPSDGERLDAYVAGRAAWPRMMTAPASRAIVTAAFRPLIDTIRRANRTRPPARRIRIVGVDTLGPPSQPPLPDKLSAREAALFDALSAALPAHGTTIYIGHAVHVGAAASDGVDWLGARLRRTFGPRYQAVGLLFRRGCWIDASGAAIRLAVDDASVEGRLGRGATVRVQPVPPVTGRVRLLGGRYEPGRAFRNRPLAATFDALVIVPQITPAASGVRCPSPAD